MKQWKCLALAVLCAALAVAAPFSGLAQEALPTFGVCIYHGEDTFISSLLEVMRTEAAGRAALITVDAQNNQNRQNDQVEELLQSDVDALIINAVDRTSAIYLLQMASRYQKPVVFINREPLLEDLETYDQAYYVGIDPKEQGILQGKMAAQYFLEQAAADKNHDGKMQLVIIKGEPGHQDAELRTLYVIKSLQAEGVTADLLQEETALWQRSLGQERMAALLNIHGEHIECVISNNDDMALGAIDALKAAGYFTGGRYIPVIGIDAISAAVEALSQGSLYATVINDAYGQGKAAVMLALLLSQGEAITPDSFPYEMNQKVIYIPSTGLITEQVPPAAQ